ncbi:signal peptidase I [Janibacter sp. G1551]|uniref:signal peptidase I n=1 Tax=Janibacter sp. G1551 TaxID=3420440 RepID=UPI003CFC34A2
MAPRGEQDVLSGGSRGVAPQPPRSAAGRLAVAIKEFVLVAAMAITLSFVVKTFLIQPFFIPSESMESTLVKNDRVIVSKLTPGPFPLQRGDVVVFADPGDWLPPTPVTDAGPVMNGVRKALTFVGLYPDTSEGHLIKRVIGLPGDKVECCDDKGRLMVNGVSIDEPYVKDGQKPSESDFSITVPQGELWVMGDNRGDSSDSRFHDPSGNGSDGSVPISLVVGKAEALVWPIDRLTRLGDHPDTFTKVPAAGVITLGRATPSGEPETDGS